MLNNALEVIFFFLFMNKYQRGEWTGRFRENEYLKTNFLNKN